MALREEEKCLCLIPGTKGRWEFSPDPDYDNFQLSKLLKRVKKEIISTANYNDEQSLAMYDYGFK